MTRDVLCETGSVDAGDVTYIFTRHVQARQRQRGVRDQEVSLLLRYGEPVSRDRVAVSNSLIEREILARRREIEALDRLRGVTAVVDGGVVITVFRNSKQRQN